MSQVLGAALAEEKDVASGQDSLRVLQSEIALLKRQLALIQEIDDEEFERLYSRMGIFCQCVSSRDFRKKEGTATLLSPSGIMCQPILDVYLGVQSTHMLPGQIYAACHRSYSIINESIGRYLPNSSKTGLEISNWFQVGTKGFFKVFTVVFKVEIE